MASTDELEVEAHERHRGCSPPSGNDSSRFDGVDRDRDLGRPDRAASRRRGRERLPSRRPELVGLHRLVRRDRADLPRRSRGGRAAVPARVAGVALDRAGQLLRAIRRRRPALLLRSRLVAPSGRDRRPCALDDEPGRRLRGAGRDRPEPRAGREAADVGHLRHRHRDGRRPDRLVRQADPLDRAVRARLGRR